LPSEPIPVVHPLNSVSGWSQIHWNRRTYEEILEVSSHVEAR
jgi:hypothetical protein